MIPAHLQPILDELARKQGELILNNAKRILDQDEYRNSGELAESLRLSVTPCTDKIPPMIRIEYAEQGYFLAYKSPKWTKVPNIDKLREWAKTIQFSGPVPGYKNGASNLPPWKAKERIISAIAWNKRKHDTWKRKPWKGPKGMDLGTLLRALNEETKEAWAREVERVLVKGIEEGAILS